MGEREKHGVRPAPTTAPPQRMAAPTPPPGPHAEKPEPRLLHETGELNPWQPEQDKVRLAVLGKLLEELNECGAIVARCIIQGIDEAEPVTGKVNRVELEKELADVWATMRSATEHFGLNVMAMNARGERKREHLKAWHQMIGAK